MTDRIKENLEATFNNCKSLKEETANEVVLVERMKNRNQQSCCFSPSWLRGLRDERRSKLSVNRSDLNTDFSRHLHACRQQTSSRMSRKREAETGWRRERGHRE